MAKNDIISVIVPVYNVEKYLDKCIDSIHNQTYKNLEIILVNDGSKDNSKSICQKWKKIDKRIIYIEQKNSGVSSARNKGIELSKGKYIVFLDSDDYVEANMVELLYSEILKNNSDIAICNFIKKSEDNYYIKKSKINKYDNKKNQYVKYLLNEYKFGGFLWNKMYLADNIKKYNILFKEDIKIMEDLIFNLEYYKYIKKFSICEEYLYNYIKRENSALNSNKKKYDYLKSNVFIVEILEKYNSKYSNQFKLNYLFVEKKAKISNGKIDVSTNENIKYLKKYRKISTFIKYGKISTKCKVIILYVLPWLYKIKR